MVLPPNDGALWDGGGDEQGLAAAAFEGGHRDCFMKHRPEEGGFRVARARARSESLDGPARKSLVRGLLKELLESRPRASG